MPLGERLVNFFSQRPLIWCNSDPNARVMVDGVIPQRTWVARTVHGVFVQEFVMLHVGLRHGLVTRAFPTDTFPPRDMTSL